ncbi:hypothetical protein D8674_038300 [Pyrus ussuriensis x Pyrus communis]|uniref:Uncharacterized protein n=1 Tax=Pyrus ussuriensis x Pyrus communis TaxID=2448454 RepID=A0A5N5IGQ1_9ROSA|nr:hypothetical protein D8674_038300 [Pyrus ussuriensis x Pyrus communis]
MSQIFRCDGCTSESKRFTTIERLRIHVHDKPLQHITLARRNVMCCKVFVMNMCVATQIRTPTKNELKKKRPNVQEGVGPSKA